MVGGQSIPSSQFRSNQVLDIDDSTECNDFFNTTNFFCGNFYAKCTHGNIKQSKGIKICHINVRSLQNKTNEIKTLITTNSPTVLGISECEIRKGPHFNENILNISGYTLFFPKSWSVLGTARVLVYVKEDFPCTQMGDLEDVNIQSIWLQGGYKNSRKLYICNFYREFTSTLGNSMKCQRQNLDIFLNQWSNALHHGNNKNENELHIIGDMNLDSLNGKWLSPQYSHHTLAMMFQKTCQSFNISQLVQGITRVQFKLSTQTSEVSCIDHVYTNTPIKCSQPKIISFGASDHDVISYSRYTKLPPVQPKTIVKRSYKNLSRELFLADMNQVDWTDVLCTINLDDAVCLFVTKFSKVLDQHAPFIKFQERKQYNMFITAETKDLMKNRDEQKSMFKSTNDPDLKKEYWIEYKKLRNRVNNKKFSDEYVYKSEVLKENSTSSAKTWSTVKKFMNWGNASTPREINDNGMTIRKSLDIANCMNNFFVDKVSNLRTKIPKVPFSASNCQEIMKNKDCALDIKHVSQFKIMKIIKSFGNSKSTAIDGLDTFSIKMAAEIISKPVHHIITLSIMQKTFPSAWKAAKVIPLHKKEDIFLAKNYRPVSILSPVSKVLERIMYEQMYEYFSRNRLFNQSMHGFRKHRSTQTILLEMYQRWLEASNKGEGSGIVMLDLSAAFDLVNSKLLLQKLAVYSLSNDFLDLIESYIHEWQNTSCMAG